MIKPKRLKKGDTIGILSPSTGVAERSDIWQAIDTFEAWGYRVRTGDHAFDRYFYLAGQDGDRVSDLNAFFADDAIDAIFCSQGGFGATRLLKDVRFDIIRDNPKIFIGYSDITALHLAINKLTGLITFHGPSATGIYGESGTTYRLEHLKKALCSSSPIGEIKMADTNKYLVKIHGGSAWGKTIGGNLTLICATLGTPYEIETTGKILFFEEVGSDIQDIDQSLTHLLNAGKLQEAAGIVIGECSACNTDVYDGGQSLEELFFDRIAPLKIPTLYGFPLGHTNDLATIPVGVNAVLNATDGNFKIIETATKND
jgi:muramoyltetrapeptide carboxypeptidase